MKPKKKELPKPVNQLWDNLYEIEHKDSKFEKEEKEFIPEEDVPVKKVIKVKQEEKVSTKFDDDSLAVYGALLSDSLDSQKPGEENATPSAQVEKILSKEEADRKEKIRQARAKKAESLLEDIPMSDEQEKQALIEEWTTYADQ